MKFKPIKETALEQYNQQILSYMMPYFLRLLPLGILGAFISVILIIMDKKYTSPFLSIDLIIMSVMLLFLLKKDWLKPETRVKITIIILLFIASLSFYRVGYLSNAVYLLLVVLIISFIFLNNNFSIILSLFVIINYFIAYIRILTDSFSPSLPPDFFFFSKIEWLFHIIGILIVIITSYISIRAIKGYLINTIIKLEEQLKTMEHLAYKDQLTDLPNRSHFKELINKSINNDENGIFMLLDIKDFNRINTFYGMDFGDTILKQTAEFALSHLSEKAVIGYLGSNTFAFYLSNSMDERSIQSRFLHYQSLLNNQLALNSPLSFYCVVLPFQKSTSDFDSIFKISDRLLKQLKQNDKTNYIYYNENTQAALESYNALYKVVDQAVADKKFQVYFQEKVNSITGEVVGLEALARLFDNGQFISPRDFIPIIEENNFSSSFGWIIIEKVFSLLPEIHNKYGDHITVSINLSPKQLQSNTFFNKLSQYIDFYNVKPHMIEFEITENVVMGNYDEAIQILSRLRSLGINISIDDFGTGYSSLQYICDLPIDVLKIDKSFIDQLTHQGKMKAIISAIVKIAETVHISVIAEGVESEDQVIALKELGCYIIQGYVYSKPKPLQ